MSYRRFFLVRLGWALGAVWLAVTLVCVITRVVLKQPHHPKESSAPQRRPGLSAFAPPRAPTLFEQLHLDEPVPQRYGDFVSDGYDIQVLGTVLLLATFAAIGVHFVVDVIVCALDPDLRAEWPVAGLPGRP